MAFKGGSLVSNILQKSSTLDQKLIESSAQKLSKKAGQLKGELYEHIRQNYVEFHSYAQTSTDLEEKLREVDNEYRRLEAKVGGELKEKLAQSADKRKEFEGKLREVQQKIDFVQRLVSLHEGLQASKQSLGAGSFTEAVGSLQKVSEDLKDLAELGCEAKVFNALQEETAVLCSEADLSLVEEWNKCVSWAPEPAPVEPSLSVTLMTELRVRVVVSSVGRGPSEEEEGLGSVVAACKMLEIWPRIQSAFGRKLLHLFVRPLISNTTLGVTREVEAGKDRVVLKFVEIKASVAVSGKEWVSQLYKNLVTVFKLVRQILPQEDEWMREVGRMVCPEMTGLIINQCLATAVPKTPEELKQYEAVQSLTTEFEASLIELAVVETDFCELSKYTQNIEVHFEEQKRKDLLANARTILKKTIHDTEIVSPPENLDPLPPFPFPPGTRTPQEEAVSELCLIGAEDQLKDFGANFPVCTVSKCVKEFVNLLHETLRDCYARETAADKLEMFRTARDMVELFRAVIPTQHKRDIATIPMAAAVHYNNCMYVAHYLIVTSVQIQQHLKPHHSFATFVDQIPFVRQMGEDAFQQEMKKQRNSILGSLKEFCDFSDVSGENKRDEVYRGVRQGLFQITQLSRVYKEALPAHVHKDSVGSLLDSLVSHVVKGILALEDIVSADASELHEILDIILEKGPSIMQFSKEQAKDVSLYCASWIKLQDLAFILNARLYEIVDRWAQGKGSLAQHFKPVEVRTLIKALFTNTDRRAAALSKITM